MGDGRSDGADSSISLYLFKQSFYCQAGIIDLLVFVVAHFL